MIVDIEPLLRQVMRAARYTGGEWNSVTKEWPGRLHVALAYPGIYEEGVAQHDALTLYHLLNRSQDVLCERAYLPASDMDAALRGAGLPLFGLETRHALTDCDLLLVYLPSEAYFGGLLTLLDLSRLPLHAAQRQGAPWVLGVGPACANPEPVAAFCDGFLLGDIDGPALEQAYRALQTGSEPPPWLYLPGRYSVPYSAHGAGASGAPGPRLQPYRPAVRPPLVARPLVPFVEAVRERAVIELGDLAGERERAADEILANIEQVLSATGYDQVELHGRHSALGEIIASLSARYGGTGRHVRFQLTPAPEMTLHMVDMVDRLPQRRRSALSAVLPPSDHQADQEEIAAAKEAFKRGWHILRLSATLGLPGETLATVRALAERVRLLRDVGRTQLGQKAQIQLQVEALLPRPHTPWQRAAMLSEEEWAERVVLLKTLIRGGGVQLRANRAPRWQAALARGDRRTAQAIELAWQGGLRLPGSDSEAAWLDAFAAAGLDLPFFAERERPAAEALPWQHLPPAPGQQVVDE